MSHVFFLPHRLSFPYKMTNLKKRYWVIYVVSFKCLGNHLWLIVVLFHLNEGKGATLMIIVMPPNVWTPKKSHFFMFTITHAVSDSGGPIVGLLWFEQSYPLKYFFWTTLACVKSTLCKNVTLIGRNAISQVKMEQWKQNYT